jgi:hypothetical protein
VGPDSIGRPGLALFGGALFQHRDGRQGLAFEEFQEGAAAGGM